MDAQRRRFTMDRCLGRGGFGEVYLATMHSAGGLETPVAVKVLRSDLDLRTDAVRRLRDEGRMLARLNHPTILKVYDLVMLEGRVSLVTEFIEGADLCDCWEGSNPLPLRGSLQAISAVASALQAAWDTPGRDGEPLRLIHRDVKPTNIRVGRHGEVKLLDFGIACAQAMEREASTASDVVVGSLSYMSPERFMTKDIGPSADVFSLGCVLYEGIGAECFFGHGHLRTVSAMALDPDKYDRHLNKQLEAVGEAPGEVLTLLRALLSYKPEGRPDADEVALRCDQIADELRGASLRIWCRDRDWGAGDAVVGELEGRMLTEGSLELTGSTSSSSSPVIQRRPIRTIDPAADSKESTMDIEGDFSPPVMPPAPKTGPSVHDRPYTDDHGMFSPASEPEPRPRRVWPYVMVGGLILTGLVAAILVMLGLTGVGVAITVN